MKLVHRILGRRPFGIHGLFSNPYSNYALALDFKKNQYKTKLGTTSNLMGQRGPELATATYTTASGGYDNVTTALSATSFQTVKGTTASRCAFNIPGAVIGKTYAVSCHIASSIPGNIQLFSRDGLNGGGATINSTAQSGAGQIMTLTFTATTTTPSILWVGTSSTGDNFTIDNISVREVAATYTRSGDKYELDASGNPIHEAPNVPGIVPGVGYWSRQSLTNLLVQSQAFDSASWQKSNGATVTANTAVAPDGTTTADTLVCPHNVDASADVYQPVTLTNATAYSHSIWLRADSAGTWPINFFDGSTHHYLMVNVTTAWQRFTITATTTGTACYFYACDKRSGAGTLSSVYAWQAQLVAGTDPGPIIVTTGAAATVGADALSTVPPVAADQDFIMWAVANLPAAGGVNSMALINDGTANNVFGLTRASGGAVQAYIRSAGGAYTFLSTSAIAAGRSVLMLRRKAGKLCAAHKDSSGAIVIGAETTLTGPVGPLTTMQVGRDSFNNGPCNCPIEFIGSKLGTFSDADLTALLQSA